MTRKQKASLFDSLTVFDVLCLCLNAPGHHSKIFGFEDSGSRIYTIICSGALKSGLRSDRGDQ